MICDFQKFKCACLDAQTSKSATFDCVAGMAPLQELRLAE